MSVRKTLALFSSLRDQIEDLELGGGGGGLDPESPDASGSAPPVVTPVDPVAVDQGALWTTTHTADTNWPNMVWLMSDYTGTPATYNRASETGTFAGIENTPGTYTAKVRAAWPFGISAEQSFTVVVNPFTLTRDTMFGGADGYYTRLDISGDDTNYVAVQGAVVNDGGTYTWDNGSIVADSANCIGFWSYTSNRLLAFRYNSSGTLEYPFSWSAVATLPAQGDTFASGGSSWTSTTSQRTAANNSSINDHRVPLGGYYNGGLGSTHYLEMSVADSSFNNFGSKTHSWSYGFRLKDDWIANAFITQMLAPVGAGYFVNGITGYGIGSSPYEYVGYGDDEYGPYSSSSSGGSWSASSTNWLIGSAGDMVVVTYDGTTWSCYVEGVLRFSSTSLSLYMDSGTTQTQLRLGDISPTLQGSPVAEEDISGWYSRLDNLFVAVGTAFDSAQVSEITTDKADLTLSDNYASMTHLATFDGVGVTSVKGGLSFSRGDQ